MMGPLTKGSGTAQPRDLCVRMSFMRALTTLSSRLSIKMDTVLVNGRLSVNIAGIGFDGHVAGLFGKNGKRGLIGYAGLVIKEFRRFKEFPVDMEVDGQPLPRSAFMVAFANSSQFGNNARVSPHASVCDQRIDSLCSSCLLRVLCDPVLAKFKVTKNTKDHNGHEENLNPVRRTPDSFRGTENR